METIQSKLNREQDRMKEFQTIIDKYVRMYKDNKSKIERRDTILRFKEDMQEIEERAIAYQQSEKEVETAKNKIACFIKELYRLEELIEQSRQELDGKIQTCDTELARITYEKLSMEIHQMADELSEIVVAELKKIAEQGPLATDIDKTREYLLKEWQNQLRDNHTWLQFIDMYYNNGLDYPALYEQTVKEMSAEKIQALAQKILSDNNMVYVVMRPQK